MDSCSNLQTPAERNRAIDALRGLVMVIMALDHTRDFFSNATHPPEDLSTTTPAYFFTRWMTHYCAPVFVLLAGVGAFLHRNSGGGVNQRSRYLVSRGLWLIVLEFTLVRWGWMFNLDYGFIIGQVIWAIGVSMIVLAALIRLPVRWVCALGIFIILTHNLLDGVRPAEDSLGFAPWAILHTGETVPLGSGRVFFPLYPVLPWIGVMAAGYGMGPLFLSEATQRRRWLLALGGAMCAAFLGLRAINVYGDPNPWTNQPTFVFGLISFLNCTKYPPSLLYLLMTLGPALMLLSALETKASLRPQWLVVFGRVPLFYYLAHIYLIHFLAGVLVSLRGRPDEIGVVWHGLPMGPNRPSTYGYNLALVYCVWVVVVGALYPACRWYASVKSRSRSRWLSLL